MKNVNFVFLVFILASFQMMPNIMPSYIPLKTFPSLSDRVIASDEPHHEKPCIRLFPTRSDTNRAVQPQKMARDLKFCIEEVEGFNNL